MNEPSPTISVVIPTYNRSALLPEALQSVFAQTYGDYEVVVVDDGSTDDTPRALQPFADRLRCVHQTNQGEAAARNRGVREARGEWIAFLDSDDRWVAEALGTLVTATQRFPEAGLIAMRSRRLAADGSISGRAQGKNSRGWYFSTASLLWGDSGGVLTPMVRRSLLLSAGGFDTSLSSATDCDMWIRLSFMTTMVGIPDALLLRRFHASNMTRDRVQNAEMWLRILERLAREHPEFVRRHPWVYRRARGKEHLRLGRGLLRAGARDAPSLARSREHLLRSIRSYPFFIRSYLSLAECLRRAAARPAARGRSIAKRGT